MGFSGGWNWPCFSSYREETWLSTEQGCFSFVWQLSINVVTLGWHLVVIKSRTRKHQGWKSVSITLLSTTKPLSTEKTEGYPRTTKPLSTEETEGYPRTPCTDLFFVQDDWPVGAWSSSALREGLACLVDMGKSGHLFGISALLWMCIKIFC